MQRVWLVLLATLFTLAVVISFKDQILCRLNYMPVMDRFIFGPKIQVPLEISAQDQNLNGISDTLDIVSGARQDVARRTRYDNSYYQGGYPPDGRGNATDVIWRGFKAAGYNLKDMVDEDIKNASYAYGMTSNNVPDPNIDFRRVPTLLVFLQRHAIEMTIEVKPGVVSNLVQWQPGDIVVFGPPTEHIAIISDRRRKDGVPLVIHNAGPWATEGDYLLRWSSKITHHYRYIL